MLETVRLALPILVWIVLIVMVCARCREHGEDIAVFREMVRAVRVGVCERSLSLAQIMESLPESSSLTEYLDAHALPLSEITVGKIRAFEAAAPSASALECAQMIRAIEENTEQELDAALAALGVRRTEQVTLCTAAALIALIVMV